MTGLSDTVTANRTAEITRAARALLRRPVLRAHGPGRDEAEHVVLVRRHATVLREWFDRNTGWRLVVDSEVARLVKAVPDTADATHPARDPRTRLPFGRRRYVLACLALAVLERADAQITLGRLAEQIVLGAADPALTAAGVTFTLDRRDERTDLIAVVRLLLDLGAIARVAGDEESFVRSEGDALYDVDRRVLAALLATPRGPSTVLAEAFADRLAALAEELPATTDELRNQQIRHRLTRRLLDGPVLYHDELDETELAYLAGQRHAITSRIAELTGLVAEVRAEGIAMVDPLDDLTDVRMPESGTEGHVTLLLAEHLARADGPVPVSELHAHIREQAAEHRGYWRRDAAAGGAEVELTAQALRRLTALRLVELSGDITTGDIRTGDITTGDITTGDITTGDDTVRARPALARYAIGAPTIQTPKGAS